MNDFFHNIKKDNQYRYYDGRGWRESAGDESIEIRSPIDNSLLGIVRQNTPAELNEIVFNLHLGQMQWRATSIDDRAALLKKAAEFMRHEVEALSQIQTLETGKLATSSAKDILRSADVLDYTADQLEVAKGLMTIKGSDFSADAARKTAYIEREPHGIVLAISPFNYPINLAVTKIAPALLMGNSVILKGPTQGTLSTAMLVEIFMRAGIPDGVIASAVGTGSAIGDFLTQHRGIQCISFTGSTHVGHHIARLAGHKVLQMELGGKDAALVLPDADIDLAATEIVQGTFSYAGQRCTAIKRVLVMHEVRELLAAKIVEKTNELFSVLGDPREAATQLGPLISKKAAAYAIELLEDAQQDGAVFLTGGVVQGNYVEATVVDGVTSDMRLAWEEQFAPILPIISCQDINEMIDLHNRSEYGLGASIFTANMELAHEVASRLEAGVIQINAKSERYPDHFPFLGIKNSGLGTQGIRWSLESMSRIKSVVVNK